MLYIYFTQYAGSAIDLLSEQPLGNFEHFFPLCVTSDGVICSMKTIKNWI